MLVRLILISWCFALSTSVVAQGRGCNDEVCVTRTYIDPARRALEHQLGRYKPFVEKDAPYLFEKGAVRVRSFADFNAFADYSNRQIVLPAQFIVESAFYCDAFARASLDHSHMEGIKRYQDYLVRRSERARRAGGVDNMLLRNYASFIGESDEQHARVDSPELRARMGQCSYEALAFVLAHEIGHMALGHRSDNTITPKQSRAQERAADEFAISLTQKAGMETLVGGGAILSRFASSEAVFGAADEASRTHPLTECRVYRFINPQVVRNGHTEEFKRNLRATGQSLATWEREWRELGEHCRRDDN